jgi:hypothetical protein
MCIGKAHEADRLPLLLQGDQPWLGLFYQTAEIALGMHDEKGQMDVLGVRQR